MAVPQWAVNLMANVKGKKKRAKQHKPLNITRREAIYDALDEIGDKTSISTLMEVARSFYGDDSITYTMCSLYRHQYRKEYGLTTDCRSYSGQPRRDMCSDDHVPGPIQRRVDNLSDDDKRRIRAFIKGVGNSFHSIDQLLIALS